MLCRKMRTSTNIWRSFAFVDSFHDADEDLMSFSTASFVGRAGIAPLSVTVMAPQAFANRSASLNRFSSCHNENKQEKCDAHVNTAGVFINR